MSCRTSVGRRLASGRLASGRPASLDGGCAPFSFLCSKSSGGTGRCLPQGAALLKLRRGRVRRDTAGSYDRRVICPVLEPAAQRQRSQAALPGMPGNVALALSQNRSFSLVV